MKKKFNDWLAALLLQWMLQWYRLCYALRKRILRRAIANKRPDVIVHIGAPKTGTSAIQRFCMTNRFALLRAGYYYPEHWMDRNGVSSGHYMLCQSNPSASVTGLQLFSEWVAIARSSGRTLLLSSESFYTHFEMMGAMLKNHDVRVIGWYRSPLLSIVSNYNQEVKRHFISYTLEQRCRKILSNTSIRHFDGYYLHAWADLFGDAHCKFYPFLYPDVEPIEWRFLAAIGVKASKVSRFKIDNALINRSYAPDALELKRRLNLLMRHEDVALNRALDVFLQGYSDQLAHQAMAHASLLPNQTMEMLKQHFCNIHEALRSRFPALTPVLDTFSDSDVPASNSAHVVSTQDLIDLWQRLVLALPDQANELLQRLDRVQIQSPGSAWNLLVEVMIGPLNKTTAVAGVHVANG